MASYEKRPSGLWSVRFKTMTSDGVETYKRLSGYKTKKEAQYAYEDYLRNPEPQPSQIPAPTPEPEPTASDMLFSELVNLFFIFKKPRLKAQSYYDLEKKIRDKIIPFFGNMAVKDITPLIVLDWQSKVLAGYSYKYQKDIHTYLVSIYNYASKYHDIIDIMDKVDPPANLDGKKEMLIWSPEEFAAVIPNVTNTPYNILYKFLYVSGARRGEALALTWEDIDFEKHTVKINKNVAYKVGKNGKPYQVYTPKNLTSNRTLHLPPSIFSELESYRAWQIENTKSQNFIFGAEDPLPPTSIERHLTNAAKKAGVKRIRIHDLRHSCASVLIHKGVTIVAVSKHLGHKTVKQTLDTYAHLLPDDNSMIVSALSSIRL